MKTSIFPLSDVPRERVIEFLVSSGISPERAAWRYYDDRFSRGRNRAFVWFKDDMVKGFIGIIPCTLSTPEGDRPIAWTCNWFLRDPRGTPSMGILLLKRVHASYDMVGAVGGTADTKASLPNMDTRSVVNAAITFHRPFKLSGLLEKVENRFVQLPKLSRTLLGAIPLPRRKVDGAAPIKVEDGVSPALEPLFDQPQHGSCRVRYDHEYVDWQVGRCPGFRSLSLIATDNDPARGDRRRDELHRAQRSRPTLDHRIALGWQRDRESSQAGFHRWPTPAALHHPRGRYGGTGV